MSTTEWVMSDGVRLVGKLEGLAGGKPVVLLHGGGQTRHSWQGTCEELVRLGYLVLTYDARGHGESDWSPTEDYSLNFFARDLIAVTSLVGMHSPALVGASLGGDTSLVAAGRLGMEVGSVVLVDVVPKAEKAGVLRAQEFLKSDADGFGTLREMAEAIARYQPHRRRSYNPKTLRKNVRLGNDSRFRWHFDPAFAARSLDLSQRQLELEAALGAVDAPLLLVRGGLSDVISDEGVEAFRAFRPDALCVSVAEAAHMVAGDENDVFTSALVQFLDGVPRRPIRESLKNDT